MAADSTAVSVRLIGADDPARPILPPAGRHPQIETALNPGQIITAVTLPPSPKGTQMYRKVRDRASYAFALVSVAAIVETAGGKIRAARFAFGGLAPKPWRVAEAELPLEGSTPSEAAFAKAGDAVVAGGRGYGHNDFKLPLVASVHLVLARVEIPSLAEICLLTPEDRVWFFKLGERL